MSGKEDLESPSNSSSLKKIDISKGPFNITVSNAATIKVVNTFMEDKEKENETRLTSFVHSQSIKLKKKEKEYEKKLDEREKNLPEEKERELKEKEEVIAGLQQEKVELVKRVEELEQNLSRVQSINSQLSADVTLLRSTFKTNQTEIDTKIKDLEDRLAAEKKREGLKAAAYNYSSEVSNYYLKHSLLPLLTTTSGYASFGFEEIQNVYEIAMKNYNGLIDGDHQVLLKNLKTIIPPPSSNPFTPQTKKRAPVEIQPFNK
ncbi:hypothetical protein DDB_G0288283 [Dictyostelium discoideum AX4]|uniref:Uncharacterized protein n=1 Tax=Dictyostelium discoideum TaxID=44689 RepID=Q54J56_DICDI|nr:hypothetical protein DDB_G0288283 [Dictyostelium discoideum AX4]EAL63284.1 hypothetical protein DDB_G0288283 [Dictyostelium discoideum AX4]|eukprot:XP_636791.1 hypothetical protein DDB_G0288283 [Dictyostelium discoideum AX4]